MRLWTQRNLSADDKQTDPPVDEKTNLPVDDEQTDLPVDEKRNLPVDDEQTDLPVDEKRNLPVDGEQTDLPVDEKRNLPVNKQKVLPVDEAGEDVLSSLHTRSTRSSTQPSVHHQPSLSPWPLTPWPLTEVVEVVTDDWHLCVLLPTCAVCPRCETS